MSTFTSGKSKVGVGVMDGVGVMVGVGVIVGVSVWVGLSVKIAVGNGVGVKVGNGFGVRVAVKITVWVDVGELGIDSWLEHPAMNNNPRIDNEVERIKARS